MELGITKLYKMCGLKPFTTQLLIIIVISTKIPPTNYYLHNLAYNLRGGRARFVMSPASAATD